MSNWINKSHLLHKNPVREIKEAYTDIKGQVSVQVSYASFGGIRVTHLWICRKDDKPMGWTELQRVKSSLLGAEVMAVQVFPKESNMVNQANMYHLWAFPEGFDLGVVESGFTF